MTLWMEKLSVVHAAMTITLVGIVFCIIIIRESHASSDPWQRLRDSVDNKASSKTTREAESDPDPWTRLRKLYLPFTEEQESAALVDPSAGKKVSGHLLEVLQPFSGSIAQASQRFAIPPEIIGAVIMVESGGDPEAAAQTSSARGLMQTISGTFHAARNDLLTQGTRIPESPFDPHASIMAGSWYLDRMYAQAAADRKPGVADRNRIDSWRHPVQYYYAGPSNGKKDKNIVIIYSGGRKVVIDKSAYSEKVLKWAQIMHQRRKG